MARSLVVDGSSVADGSDLKSAACLPLDDDGTYEIGPGCLLTTVFLCGDGAQKQSGGRKGKGGQAHSSSTPVTLEGEEEEGDDDDDDDGDGDGDDEDGNGANEEEEAAALRALGLPVSFGTSKSYKGRRRASRGGRAAGSPCSPVEASPLKASSSPSPAPSPSNNNKSTICLHYKRPGGCCRGDKCPFAHGNADRTRAQKEKKKKEFQGSRKYPKVRRPAGSDPLTYRPPYRGQPYSDANLDKYFRNRGWLWSHEIYEKGIKMDDDMWYSVTPFALARHHARRLLSLESSEVNSSSSSSRESSRRGPGRLVLDGFAGVGGDAAALAVAGARVVAVDVSVPRLQAARSNAELFFAGDSSPQSSSDVSGERKKEDGEGEGGEEPDCGEQTQQQQQQQSRNNNKGLFDVVAADFFCVAPRLRVDCVFMSPPWGGPGYSGGGGTSNGEESYFRVKDDIGELGVGIGGLLAAAASAHAPGAPLDVAVFLPRSTFLPDLVEAAESLGVCLEVERAVGEGSEKAIGVTAYFGASARRKS